MKCSISAGHSCNVVMIAIMQNGRAAQKRQGGLPCTVCGRPSVCLQQHGHRIVVLVPAWRDWFGCLGLGILYGSININTKWDEINPDPEIISWGCVSLISSFLWAHPIPAFFCMLCSSMRPSWNGYLNVSFYRMLFPPLLLFGNMWLWAVRQPGTQDNLWQSVVASSSLFFSPHLNLQTEQCNLQTAWQKSCFHNISSLSCFFLARFLMIWTFVLFFGTNSSSSWKGIFSLLLCSLFRFYTFKHI